MPRISEDKIFEIRSAVNIVHYISQFVNLKKAGQNFKGLCPFHTEKTPSFIVSPEKQIFHCFGCGKGGNVFSFIMDYEKLAFTESLKKAADFAGIILEFEKSSPEQNNYFQRLYGINEQACLHFERSISLAINKKWLQYFLDRDISENTIHTFRLGYAPDSFHLLLNEMKKSATDLNEAAKLGLIQAKDGGKGYYDKFRHRVIFPFQNAGGKIIGFGGRKLKKEQQPKYLNSPESPVYKKGEILYGLNHAINSIRSAGYAILVEGYFDLLRLVDRGLKQVVASSGTAFTDEQIKLLRRYTKNIYIAYDGDNAGIKAAVRNAGLIEKLDLNAFIIRLPENEDPDSFVLKNGLSAFEKLIEQKQQPLEFQIDAFLAGNKTPDIEQKNEFIARILDDLAEFHDQVKLGLYIHQLSDRLQINESMLISQVNRIQRYRRRFRHKDEVETEQEKTKTALKYRTGIEKAEAGLISMLLNSDEEIQNYILEHVEHDLIENHHLLILYESIMHMHEESGKIDSDKILLEFQEDKAMTEALSEIVLNDSSNSMKFAKDCIFQLKKWRLEKQAQETSKLIKEESASDKAVLHHTMQLSRIRKEIDILEREHKSY